MTPTNDPALDPLRARKTYGKKRFLAPPNRLEADPNEFPAKKSRTMSGSAKPGNQSHSDIPVPLQNVSVNTPRLSNSSSLCPGLLPQRVSPVKPWAKGILIQNALDSPFLEPRKLGHPVGPSVGPGFRRALSPLKPKKGTQLRHLSLNRSNLDNKAHAVQETPAEALRRKTSEATTTLGATAGEHSWLVHPPARISPIRVCPDPSTLDFTFDPLAESTVAHVRRPLRGPPAGTALDASVMDRDDRTPLARRSSLHDEMMALSLKETKGHRKCHDSILSSDSEDLGTSFSIFGLTPKPKWANLLPEDDEMTPRNPPLIEQLCGQRSRPGSISVRQLNQKLPASVPVLCSSSDADDEMGEEPFPQQDTSIGALSDACGGMGLGSSSSPCRIIKAAPKSERRRRDENSTKKHIQRAGSSDKPYHLSPRTVHRLSKQRRVGMRIEDRPLSPNEEIDIFATYKFDGGWDKGSVN